MASTLPITTPTGKPGEPEEPGDDGEREHDRETHDERSQQAWHPAAGAAADPPPDGTACAGESHHQGHGHEDQAERHQQQQRNPDDGHREHHDGDDQQRHEEQLRRQADEPRAPRLGRHPVCHAPNRRRQDGDHQGGQQADEPDPDERRHEIERSAERVRDGVAEPMPVVPRAEVRERSERRAADPDLVDLPGHHVSVGPLDGAADSRDVASHIGLRPEVDRPGDGHHIPVHPAIDARGPEDRHDVVADRLVLGHGHVTAEADPRAAVAVPGHFVPPLPRHGRRRGRRPPGEAGAAGGAGRAAGAPAKNALLPAASRNDSCATRSASSPSRSRSSRPVSGTPSTATCPSLRSMVLTRARSALGTSSMPWRTSIT